MVKPVALPPVAFKFEVLRLVKLPFGAEIVLFAVILFEAVMLADPRLPENVPLPAVRLLAVKLVKLPFAALTLVKPVALPPVAFKFEVLRLVKLPFGAETVLFAVILFEAVMLAAPRFPENVPLPAVILLVERLLVTVKLLAVALPLRLMVLPDRLVMVSNTCKPLV